jgi:hypothetical protein
VGFRGLDAGVWRQRTERRYQDLAAGFDWLLDHGRSGDALELATTLAEFHRISGRVATGRGRLDRALAAAAPDEPRRAVALYEHGMLAFWHGADKDACSLLGQSLHLARRLGDHTTIALALCGLARVALREDLDWAQALCEEALAVVAGTGDRLGRASAQHVLGVAAQMRGDLPSARELMTARIEAARKPGDEASVGSESANLGMVERQLGDLASADRLEAWSAGRRMPSAQVVRYARNPLPVGAEVAF